MNDGATIEDLREVNIFYLDSDPAAAARAHCDRHVVKMILETAQLLSTAWHVVAPHAIETDVDSTDPAFPRSDVARARAANLPFDTKYYLAGNQRIYACTHREHPCAIWVRSGREQYDWAWRLGMHLLDEYTHRYRKDHATTPILRTLEFPPPKLPVNGPKGPALAMPDEFKRRGDPVASYRAYYRDGKRHLLKYTRRAPPSWLRDVAEYRDA